MLIKWTSSFLILGLMDVLFTIFLQICSMFCCGLLCVHSSFALILMGQRGLVALLCLFVFLVSRDCCVALPHGVTGLSAVCDCNIS